MGETRNCRLPRLSISIPTPGQNASSCSTAGAIAAFSRLEYLEVFEALLRQQRNDPDLLLSDCFALIGGARPRARSSPPASPAAFEKEARFMAESNLDGPRKVVLFSGHMIDAPGREKPRFPPDKEPTAAQAIAGALADLHVGPDDLCICGGACGGDLLFAEDALARSALLEIYIPFEEPTFLENSVDLANKDWRARFFAAKARSALHIAPRELGPAPEGEDPYERNNRWMLDAALRFGADKVDLICLWNGEGGDGPGGAQHMMEEVRKQGGRTVWLDTRKLWG
jgi:hypothetical protein